MKRFHAGLLVLGIVNASAAADAPRHADLELVVLGGPKVARVRVEAADGATPLRALWDSLFTALFRAADRNGDETLDAAEAEHLPGVFALRQGPPYLNPGYPPARSELDGDHDGKVGRDELARAYRFRGLGGILVGAGRPTSAPALNAELLRQLDANGDGRFDPSEAASAAARLLERDTNADELIEPAELVPHTPYPGTTAAELVPPPTRDEASQPADGMVPVIVLPLDATDPSWAAPLLARLDANGDHRLDRREAALTTAAFDALDRVRDGFLVADELAAWPTLPPDAVWTVRTDEKASGAATEVTVGDIRLVLRTAPGTLPLNFAAATKRLQNQFNEADTNRDHRIDANESAAPQAAELRRVVAPADRNRDGVLAADELDAWLAVQGEVVRSHLTLNLVDHGPSLFEQLDADHDGVLSAREIGTARTRLAAARVVSDDGRFHPENLSRTLVGTLSRGRPRAAYRPPRAGASWFRAMDRNGDGDVSRREFLGSASAFEKLDTDHDGLLNDREAAAASKPR